MTSNELIDKLESLDLEDKPQDIVIKPVGIDQSRNHRVSVVLAAGNGEEIRPKLGIYSINGHFLRPTKVNKWVMVFLFDKQAVDDLAQGKYTFENIKDFANLYTQVGVSKGISITPLTSIQCIPAQATIERNVETVSSQDLKDELRRLFIKLNHNLVNHAIIILPDNTPLWIHGYLQYLETCKWDGLITDGDSPGSVEGKLMKTSRIRLKTLVDLGIKSSCGGERSLIPQIWLKYNIKLGGLNVSLKRTFDTHDMKFLNDGHLIISVDLSQRDDQRTLESPLISVAVGMWDLASPQMSFHTQTRVQPRAADGRVDLTAVKDLEQMIAEIIAAYKKRNDNQIPNRVIVFRAGYYEQADNESTIQEIVSIKKVLSDAHALQEAVCSGEQVKIPVLTYLKIPKRGVIRKHKAAAIANRPPSANVVQTGRLVDSIVSSTTEVPQVEPKEFPPVVKPKFPPVVKREPGTRAFTFDRSKSQIYKLYDEAKMSNEAIQTMIYALSFLSPRVTAMTRPTPIDLADLAGERTHNTVITWMEEHQIKPEDPEFLPEVNRFLAYEMGDSTYKDYLYYA